VKHLLLSLWLAVGLHAATTTQVNCSSESSRLGIAAYKSITDPSACAIARYDGFTGANAYASADYVLAEAYESNYLDDTGEWVFVDHYATAESETTYWVLTDGPLRPGFIDYLVWVETNSIDGWTQATFMIGDAGGSGFDGTQDSWYFEDSVPVILGAPIRITQQLFATISGDSASAGSNFVRVRAFNWNIREVPLPSDEPEQIPEPSTAPLTLGALSLAILKVHRRKSRTTAEFRAHV
jgi:hypothetical protein